MPFRPITMALAVLSLTTLSRGTDPCPPPPTDAPTDLASRMAPLRQQLASNEYPQREAGQRELDKISPTQVDALRSLADAESDAEVKARFEARVCAMELYNLLHPPGISLDLKDATLSDVAAAINRQLNGAVVLQGSAAGPVFTLHTDNAPFWKVIDQLHRQNPVSVSTGSVASGSSPSVRLTPMPNGATRASYTLVDTFAHTVQVSGSQATGNWSVRVVFYADPRVKVSQYSARMLVDKITDQDGHSLLPFLASNAPVMSNSSRYVCSWTCTATLNGLPGLQRIRELHASVPLTVIAREQTASFDLTKPEPPPPIQTSRGQFSIDAGFGGDSWLLRLTPPAAADPAAVFTGSPAPLMYIRMLDAAGTLISSTITTSTQLNLSLPRGGRAPVKVEITWPDKLRDIVLPVDLKDMDVPGNPAAR